MISRWLNRAAFDAGYAAARRDAQATIESYVATLPLDDPAGRIIKKAVESVGRCIANRTSVRAYAEHIIQKADADR